MALARCRRCESLYRLGDSESECRYHPGQYRRWWTCCRALEEGAPGCRTGEHLEDPEATAMLDALASMGGAPAARVTNAPEVVNEDVLILEGPAGALHQLTLPIANAAQGELPASDADNGDGHGGLGGGEAPEAELEATEAVLEPYLVGAQDTFGSICLRHGMSPSELMHVNRLRHRQVRPGETVLVWVRRTRSEREEECKSRLVRRFRRLNRCSVGEALYYLEGSGLELSAALQRRMDDLQWERQQEQSAQCSKQCSTAGGEAAKLAVPAVATPASARLPHPFARAVMRCAHAAARGWGCRCIAMPMDAA